MAQTLQQVQQQKQRQIQVATQMQMQLSHLLELPADAIEEELQKQLDDNPALERDKAREEDIFSNRPDSFHVRRSSESPETLEDFIADTPTDADILNRQIAELTLSTTERRAMEYLVGSLDDSGYLKKDDATLSDELSFRLYIDLTEEEVHRLVGLIQTFEPAGIGAHSLQECLLLQLPAGSTAARVVEQCFDDYANRRWERVRQMLGISEAELKTADHDIRHCNPRPGLALTDASRTAAPTLTPDFYLTPDSDGTLEVVLAWRHEPQLKVSETFKSIVEEYASIERPTRSQQETYTYAKDRVDRAQSYIENIRRSRELLLRTMKEIAQHQRDFFLNDDDDSMLKPLKLQDIANRVGADTSTISRAANSKYVETPYGLYKLSHFFNAQTIIKDGQQVSTTQAKMLLRTLIEEENPTSPYTDEQLEQLMSESGYKIARRTIAKYRKLMGILPVKLRVKA